MLIIFADEGTKVVSVLHVWFLNRGNTGTLAQK